MSKRNGLVEKWAYMGAKYIKHNGGDPGISLSTLHFSLQLWMSVVLSMLLSISISSCLGTALETLACLFIIGFLRYFSGGWHFRSLDQCVIFTVLIVVLIPLIPRVEPIILIVCNLLSFILVSWLAPTGHGQKFSSSTQRSLFKGFAIAIVFFNFFYVSQIFTFSILCQSLTLINIEGRKKDDPQENP